MPNGNGINNRDKKTHKDKKKGKFLKQKKQNIHDAGVLPEFTVESDGTSYKSSDGPKRQRFREVLKRNMTKKPKRELRKTFNRVAKDSMEGAGEVISTAMGKVCLLYTSPSPRDVEESRMPSSA